MTPHLAAATLIAVIGGISLCIAGIGFGNPWLFMGGVGVVVAGVVCAGMVADRGER